MPPTDDPIILNPPTKPKATTAKVAASKKAKKPAKKPSKKK